MLRRLKLVQYCIQLASFFKENVRHLVFICRDLVSLILGTPMIIFADSRGLNRVPETP